VPKLFRLNSSVILRSESGYGSYVAFDHRRAETVFLTRSEYKILDCVASKGADAIEVSRETGATRSECERFLHRMSKMGFVLQDADVKTNPVENEQNHEEIHARFPLPLLSAPTSIDIFITSKCNLNCVHCFANADKQRGELSFDELKSVFDQLERMRVFELRINGGEPLLHPNIREILSDLGKRKFRKVLLTNGTLLNDDIADLLEKSEVIPTISLDGSNADEHDAFRGAHGSFDQTIKALILLQKREIEYGINCCVHTKNLNKCREITDLAIRYRASRIAFLDLKKVGRMKANLSWVPTREEYEQAMLELLATKVKRMKRIDVALDTFLHCRPLKETIREAEERRYVSCPAGRMRMSINSDGAVYPCNLVISDETWTMGNVRDNPLSDIWLSNKWLPFRGGMKIDDLWKCRNCGELMKCRDFYCRLLPYASSGDLLGPHPSCTQAYARQATERILRRST
jgi:radical SAM protein with 4Fe4S-binding SPASM domain